MVLSNLDGTLELPKVKKLRSRHAQMIGVFLKNLAASQFLQQPLSIHLELTNNQCGLSIVTKKEMSSISIGKQGHLVSPEVWRGILESFLKGQCIESYAVTLKVQFEHTIGAQMER